MRRCARSNSSIESSRGIALAGPCGLVRGTISSREAPVWHPPVRSPAVDKEHPFDFLSVFPLELLLLLLDESLLVRVRSGFKAVAKSHRTSDCMPHVESALAKAKNAAVDLLPVDDRILVVTT